MSISKLDSAKESLHELVLAGEDVNKRIEGLLGALPPKILTLKDLNYLEIRHSSLSSVPNEIKQLEVLSQLVLSHNKIEYVSKEVANLPKLKLLNLENNNIKQLDTDIFSKGALPSLVTLNLSKNQLSDLPTLDLCSLLELDISHNKFIDFPLDQSHNLPALMTLRGQKNAITGIPTQLSDQFPGLKTLDLSENKINEVPAELGLCARIKEMNISANPIKDRRLLKMAGDSHVKVATILEYLNQQLKKQGGPAKSSRTKKREKKESENEIVTEPSETVTIIGESSQLQGKVRSTGGGRAVRPHLVCFVMRGVSLSESVELKKFISMQNRLHDADNLCGKRINATIATHDLDKVSLPITLTSSSPENLKIVPLHSAKEETAKELISRLREEAEVVRKREKRSTYSGTYKYLNLVDKMDQLACILDKDNHVISFPPITNGDLTKVSTTTTSILVEVSSGQSQSVCKKVAEAIILESVKLAEANSLQLEQVKVVTEDGQVHTTFPDKNDLSSVPVRLSVVRK